MLSQPSIELAKGNSPRVAVIGSGHSGISCAHYLKKAGIESFLIFEALPELGGTWYENRYPGAEVDTPSHLYTYTFSAFDWTHRYADQAQLLAYQHKTVDQIGIREKFRFNAEVESAVWDEEQKLFHLNFNDGRAADFEYVISAVGFLNVPNIPKWVDKEGFKGTVVHTAKWDPALDYSGKRVGVVGTGSSAVSVVSEMAKTAGHLTVFQRSPNWIVPKGQRQFSEAERADLRAEKGYWRRFRKEYWNYEKVKIFGKQDQPGTRTNNRLRQICLNNLDAQLGDRNDLHQLLRPNYPFYGKRPVLSDTYYQAIRRSNVSFAPSISHVGSEGVIDESGKTHDLDVVVLATGYKASSYLSRIKVFGPSGRDLHKVWGADPEAYLGSAVPGFPNFFMMYGPNSNAGPVVFMLEVQAKFAADNIRDAWRRGKKTAEVRAAASRRFNAWLQKRLETSVFKSTSNYFASSTGRIVTQWPFSATRFWWIARTSRRRVMKFR